MGRNRKNKDKVGHLVKSLKPDRVDEMEEWIQEKMQPYLGIHPLSEYELTCKEKRKVEEIYDDIPDPKIWPYAKPSMVLQIMRNIDPYDDPHEPDFENPVDLMSYFMFDHPEEAMEWCGHVGRKLHKMDYSKHNLSMWRSWASSNGIDHRHFDYFWYRIFW